MASPASRIAATDEDQRSSFLAGTEGPQFGAPAPGVSSWLMRSKIRRQFLAPPRSPRSINLSARIAAWMTASS